MLFRMSLFRQASSMPRQPCIGSSLLYGTLALANLPYPPIASVAAACRSNSGFLRASKVLIEAYLYSRRLTARKRAPVCNR